MMIMMMMLLATAVVASPLVHHHRHHWKTARKDDWIIESGDFAPFVTVVDCSDSNSNSNDDGKEMSLFIRSIAISSSSAPFSFTDYPTREEIDAGIMTESVFRSPGPYGVHSFVYDQHVVVHYPAPSMHFTVVCSDGGGGNHDDDDEVVGPDRRPCIISYEITYACTSGGDGDDTPFMVLFVVVPIAAGCILVIAFAIWIFVVQPKGKREKRRNRYSTIIATPQEQLLLPTKNRRPFVVVGGGGGNQ